MEQIWTSKAHVYFLKYMMSQDKNEEFKNSSFLSWLIELACQNYTQLVKISTAAIHTACWNGQWRYNRYHVTMSKTVSYFMIILYQIIEYHGSPVHIIYDPVSYQTLYHINIIIIILYRPPIGEPKQLETPTAQAAASISVFRDSFWNKRIVDIYSIIYDPINALYDIRNDNIRCITSGALGKVLLLGGGGGGAFWVYCLF